MRWLVMLADKREHPNETRGVGRRKSGRLEAIPEFKERPNISFNSYLLNDVLDCRYDNRVIMKYY